MHIYEQWVTLLFGYELLLRRIRLSEWQITICQLVFRPELVLRISCYRKSKVDRCHEELLILA